MRFLVYWARLTLLALLVLNSVGCAVMHRVQLGDVEDEPKAKSHPISVKVSETTIDFRELASLAKIGGNLTHSRGLTNTGRGLDAYTGLFQFGPRTGTPVFNEFYARYVPDMLRQKCPKGRVTNIISLRETRSYPVVKGEIVRIDALCVS